MKELPEWYYDELAQCGTDYTKEEEILRYDQKMMKIRDIGNEANTMRRLIDLQPGDRILEIGCGTGEFSIELSKHCRHVLALDVSPGMLGFAQEKARSVNRDNVSFVKGGFLTFEHEGSPFDAVVSQLVLHHLPDFWKLVALKRIRSMLKENGKFFLRDVVYTSEVDDYDSFFSEVLENIPENAKDDIGEEIVVHIREEFSTFDWIMEGLIEKAGFSIEEAHYQNGFMATYLCTK
ncbi:class I SAM-dependent methyltransferase [Methanolobus sp. ZRKC2]|uniref:class I SAM-dependent methyltransferase n=1 Tax=Methanolobus sp. ZRKC2 TaxID=3125783 RepID=UPI003243E232